MFACSNAYIKKVWNVFAANLFNFVGSVIITLALPKILSVSEYGEWQYFLLIFTYIELCQFGFSQGVYLRFGGEFLVNLNLKLLKYQISFLCLFLSAIAAIALCLVYRDISISWVFFLMCMPIMAWRYFADYLLQATGKTDEYSRVLITDKSLFVLLIILSFIMTQKYHMTYASINVLQSFIIAKVLSAFYSGYWLKELILARGKKLRVCAIAKEIVINTRVGYKLLMSTLCSLLIVGVVRFVIVESLGKVAYGRVAIVLSICGFVMVLVNAVSVVIFPSLRRLLKTTTVDIGKYYTAAYKLFNCWLLILLMGAYPIEVLIKYWLPKYSSSIKYLFVLLPVIVFDSNWAIFGSSLLKVFRKEILIFKVTSISMVVSIALSMLVSKISNNLLTYSLLIIGVLVIRFIFMEYYVNRIFSVHLKNFNIMLLIMVVLFISFNIFLPHLIASALFSICLALIIKWHFYELRTALFTLRSIK